MGLFGFGNKNSQTQTLERIQKDEKIIQHDIARMSKEERRILAEESHEMKLITQAEQSFQKGKLGVHKLLSAHIPLKELSDAIEEYAEDLYDAEKKMNAVAVHLAAFGSEAEQLNKLGLLIEAKAKEISALTKTNYAAEFDVLANTDHLVLEIAQALTGQIRTIESILKRTYQDLEELVASKNEQEVHQKLLQEYNSNMRRVEELFANCKQTIQRVIVVSRQVEQRLEHIKQKDKELQRFIEAEKQRQKEANTYKGGFEKKQLEQLRR